ncbi:hypothetical protein VTK26DRAFT_6470 [Humicola hyalothermophila]
MTRCGAVCVVGFIDRRELLSKFFLIRFFIFILFLVFSFLFLRSRWGCVCVCVWVDEWVYLMGWIRESQPTSTVLLSRPVAVHLGLSLSVGVLVVRSGGWEVRSAWLGWWVGLHFIIIGSTAVCPVVVFVSVFVVVVVVVVVVAAAFAVEFGFWNRNRSR